MSARALPVSSAARATLCRACLLRSMAGRQPRRPLHLSTIEKRRAAQEAWDLRAEQIQKGEVQNLWDSFKERGYVKDIAGTDHQISELMRRRRIGVYVGIDPTAASLHLGHLLPLMPLFWMYMNGYRAVSVLGGATAKVGDPTGRLQTRDEVPKSERSMYVTKIHYQLKRMWQHVDAQAARFGYKKEWAWSRELANNSSWYNTTPFLKVVSRLFKGMRVGPMLSRETVKRKMSEGDGMSLAEFVYPMMQAWDWWEMFSGPRGVCMQIGGSDQYGNIVAGIDAVKLLRDTERDPAVQIPNDLLHTPVGFTVPLLTDSSGNKFGKSAGNALWLDPFMTSSADLYGYFMRRPDADVEKLLKLFTFLPLESINGIMEQHNLDPSQHHAHHVLAFEVLALVHGIPEAEATQARHKQMFSKGIIVPASPVSTGELQSHPDRLIPPSANMALRFRADIQLPESLIMGSSIARILYGAGLSESSNDAHRLISHRGAYVGGAAHYADPGTKMMRENEVSFRPVKAWFPADTKNYLIDGKLLILRRGKHFVRIVEMVSDKEWEASGRSYPGEAGKGRTRVVRELLTAANGGKNLNFTPDEIARLSERLAQMERESDGDGALEEGGAAANPNPAQAPQIRFPPNRRTQAGQLLDKFARTKRLNPQMELTVKQKTDAIDKVLADAQKALDEKRQLGQGKGANRSTEEVGVVY
ncbi:tRNA synthetase class I [Xylaria palmicola]|nr:tRNA synthetase class I [Xylaria palmicola]